MGFMRQSAFVPRSIGRTGAGLCLAACQIGPQRLGEPFLGQPLSFRRLLIGSGRAFLLLGRITHDDAARPQFRALLGEKRGPFKQRESPAPALAIHRPLWQKPPHRAQGPGPKARKCCRSSVVEHSLGKGEVESSILSGSTICSQWLSRNSASENRSKKS